MLITASTIGTMLPILKKVYECIEEDNNHYYGLIEPIIIRNIKCDVFFKPFNYIDDVLEILDAKDGKHISIVIKPFPAKSKMFNGTSFLPDSGNTFFDITFLCACVHDVMYEKLEELNKVSNISEKKLRKFSDTLLANLIYYAGGKTYKFKLWSKLVYSLSRLGGGIYHNLKKILLFMTLLATLYISGCSYPIILSELPDKPNIDTENIYYEK